MSGVSRGHLDRSTQRRFRRIFLIAAAVMVLVLTPFILNGDLRLDLAHRANLVPGGDVEQLAGAGNDLSLIVPPIRATSETGRDERRFHAAFLADSTGDRVALRALDSDRSVELPLREFDFFSASDDGAHVLFQDTRDPEEIESVLVNVETLDIAAMPSSDPWPSNIPGDWETGAWEVSPGSCDGVSPNAAFIACFQNPELATYVAGDWEIQALVYGDSDQVLPIYRGTGLRPWAGWTKDGSRLYFENEEGIWVAPVSLDMFS